MVLDRVGQGKDNWPRVEARHCLDDLAREQSARGSALGNGKRVPADADEGCRLEILYGGGDLRALAGRVEMIERLAGWQFVGVGQLVSLQAWAPRYDESLSVKHPDLLTGRLGRDALLAERRDNEVG